MEKTSILLCEDDENLGLLLSEYLQAKEYNVRLESDGEAGFDAFTSGRYDICILDVMMPKKDGFMLAQDIRRINTAIPIIFLTAKVLKEDILAGFRLGADDYITKPFSMEELLFRIEAILRRVNGKKARAIAEFKIGSLTFNVPKQLITGDNLPNPIKLTTKETELLALLIQSNGILERNFALKSIWVEDNYFNARSMDVYITKLRKILRVDPGISIVNIHGKGYKLVLPGEE